MTEQQLLDQIKADTDRINRILKYKILYPKMSVEELNQRILTCVNALEEIRWVDTVNLEGRWMQIHLFDNEPIYAKFKCYSNDKPGYCLFYGLFDHSKYPEKAYTPIPMDRCMLISEDEGRTLEFANGLNATKNCLIELGAIVNG